jgi:hypothetical protein
MAGSSAVPVKLSLFSLVGMLLNAYCAASSRQPDGACGNARLPRRVSPTGQAADQQSTGVEGLTV